MDFAIGSFDDAPERVADEAHREGQCQFTTLSLVEQPVGQSPLDRMKFQFGDLAFQPKQEAPVDRGGVVDPIPIADEATAVTAEVEDLIPVGAIACHPGDIVGEDDPDLVERDAGDEFLEAMAALSGPGGPAPVCVDDLDGLGSPAALKGPLLEGDIGGDGSPGW